MAWVPPLLLSVCTFGLVLCWKPSGVTGTPVEFRRDPAPGGTSYTGPGKIRPYELYWDTQAHRFHDRECFARPFPKSPHPGFHCDGSETTFGENGHQPYCLTFGRDPHPGVRCNGTVVEDPPGLAVTTGTGGTRPGGADLERGGMDA